MGTQYDAELVGGPLPLRDPGGLLRPGSSGPGEYHRHEHPHEIDYTLRFDSNSLKEAEG